MDYFPSCSIAGCPKKSIQMYQASISPFVMLGFHKRQRYACAGRKIPSMRTYIEIYQESQILAFAPDRLRIILWCDGRKCTSVLINSLYRVGKYHLDKKKSYFKAKYEDGYDNIHCAKIEFKTHKVEVVLQQNSVMLSFPSKAIYIYIDLSSANRISSD
jgi:hypothetical protein